MPMSEYKDKFPNSKLVSKKTGKRRSKKPKHKQGWLMTKKGGKVLYKSSWEKAVVAFLEAHEDVESFTLEGYCTYFKNKKGERRKTIVDFVVVLSNSKRVMVDVKPFNLLTYGNNPAKMVAYKSFCRRNNIEYFLLTENNMKLVDECIKKQME
jgi:hypothetical protein